MIKGLRLCSRRHLQLWDQLVLRDNVHYWQFEGPDGQSSHLQLVVPAKLKEAILPELHEGVTSGHLGIDKTLGRLKERLARTLEWCHQCESCSARKAPATHSQWFSNATSCSRHGTLPLTCTGNQYVLVASDYFTRWLEAYPIPNQEATTVARKLVGNFFCRFSPPEQLHLDQGKQFEGSVIAEICQILSIWKSSTTLYHPQSDGVVER